MEKEKSGFFKRLKAGMVKSRDNFNDGMERMFAQNRELDEEMLEELEELLLTSDMGVETTMELMGKIRRRAWEIRNAAELKDALKIETMEFFKAFGETGAKSHDKPEVIMMVGVNGTGKTTTVGKLAYKYRKEGKRVLIAAADTFRAAAVEQVSIWAGKAGVETVCRRDKADPASVAYEGVETAITKKMDVVIIDTAGRLHTQVNLMEELKKIKRAVGKRLESAPHEIILTLDATTGQNALIQARQFNEAMDVTSIALTKLDGTAKGAIVLSICKSMNIPIKYVGIGESIKDLQDFDAGNFVNALF